MIAGAIAAPRFRLDNKALITAHIHALVLETMGLKGAEKLYSKPQDLMDLDAPPNFPLMADWKTAYQMGIERHFATIVTAVEEAFAEEIKRFEWFDRAFVEARVSHFVDDLSLIHI